MPGEVSAAAAARQRDAAPPGVRLPQMLREGGGEGGWRDGHAEHLLGVALFGRGGGAGAAQVSDRDTGAFAMAIRKCRQEKSELLYGARHLRSHSAWCRGNGSSCHTLEEQRSPYRKQLRPVQLVRHGRRLHRGGGPVLDPQLVQR